MREMLNLYQNAKSILENHEESLVLHQTTYVLTLPLCFGVQTNLRRAELYGVCNISLIRVAAGIIEPRQ